MSAVLDTERRYTISEFRALVEASETKYEYLDGRVYGWQAKAGTSVPHSRICGNIQKCLDNQFEKLGRKCGTLNSDAYIAIPQKRYYRFPDVTVLCEPPIYDSLYKVAITNPSILIEVASESSRRADHGSKFALYSLIPSLREYVVFEQNSPLCTVHARTQADAPWTTVAYFRLDTQVYFPSVDIEVLLAEFYRDLVWDANGIHLVPGAGLPDYEEPYPLGEV